jgi:hypothetical protein
MPDETDETRWGLLVGDTRQVTAAALVAALVLFCFATVNEYLALQNLIQLREFNPFLDISVAFEVSLMTELHGWWWIPGYLFVITLSASHAYFNRGYLPSLILGLAPAVGAKLWIVYGIDDYVGLVSAHNVYDMVVVEGLVLATIGFLAGVGLRHVRRPERLVMRFTDPADS